MCLAGEDHGQPVHGEKTDLLGNSHENYLFLDDSEGNELDCKKKTLQK